MTPQEHGNKLTSSKAQEDITKTWKWIEKFKSIRWHYKNMKMLKCSKAQDDILRVWKWTEEFKNIVSQNLQSIKTQKHHEKEELG
jgi:hypothetical protein